MKPSQSKSTPSSSTNTSKPKKSSTKEREKRKSQSNSAELNNHNSSNSNNTSSSNEKGSPTKESTSTKLFAGIDTESLGIYAEQIGTEILREDVANLLTEDINYKLRYMINDALIRARLGGKNVFTASDLEETFEQLNVDKVYGASSNANWQPFGYQNLYYLEDKVINLADLAMTESRYLQYSETIVSNTWLSDQTNPQSSLFLHLKKYFTTMCQMIVNPDTEINQHALANIATNPNIGNIIEFFYNFAYILLSKDITYDCLTTRALDLIDTLESSHVCRLNVSEKQLKLLVRLILQRLLKSSTLKKILGPMCRTLGILCWRGPLRAFVVDKIREKIYKNDLKELNVVIEIINHLGIGVIQEIFVDNLEYFVDFIMNSDDMKLISNHSLVELYDTLLNRHLVTPYIYGMFYEMLGERILTSHAPLDDRLSQKNKQEEINVVNVKVKLLRTRRKINRAPVLRSSMSIDEVFDMPDRGSMLGLKVANCDSVQSGVGDSGVVVGKTSLLLPVLKSRFNKSITNCYNSHSLFYNL